MSVSVLVCVCLQLSHLYPYPYICTHNHISIYVHTHTYSYISVYSMCVFICTFALEYALYEGRGFLFLIALIPVPRTVPGI